MTTCIAVRCPHCQKDQVAKRGITARGTQRYLCQNIICAKSSFLLDYHNRGCLPEVKNLIIDMSLNASGVRDTARSLHMSTNTVLSELKKQEPALESVNTALLRTLKPDEVRVWTCSHDTGHIWEVILPHPSISMLLNLKDLQPRQSTLSLREFLA